MQPYLFPYIGYFQLVKSVNTFVFYDDVAYVKGGWINRNYIKDRTLFTIPIKNKSSNTKINETHIDWKSFRSDKFFKTIHFLYKDSPFFERIVSMIKEVFENEPKTIAALSSKSVVSVSNYLNIKTKFKFSSSMDYDREGMGESLVNICKHESADRYVNSAGGQDLYHKSFFSKNNITLYFLKTDNIKYNQKSKKFVPNLSIVDLLFNCSVKELNSFLNCYKIV